jgi:peptide/nickel transport system substrate-binding protein
MTPGDVVASIERARSSGASGHQLEEISEVRELPGDERIIEITTESPAPLLLTRLESVPVVPIDFDPRAPIGTGPYRWQSGSIEGPVVLRRWEGYWGEAPAYPEVQIQFVPFQEDVANMLHHGKLDVVASVSSTYIRDHMEMEGWQVIASPAVAITYLGINTSVPLLADLRIRQAISLAIDRRRLVQSIFPEGAASPAFSLVPPEVFGASPDQRTAGSDGESAHRLLVEAGRRSAVPLRLAHSERNALVADRLVVDLEAAGLDVEGENLPYDEFYRRIEEGSNDLFVFNWTYRVADASKFLDAFARTRDPDRGLGTLNGANLSNPEIDALIESAVIEPQSNLRLDKLQLAVSRVSDTFVYLPLFKPANLALVRESVVARRQGLPMLRPQDFRPVE